jgi:hypothetical protein
MDRRRFIKNALGLAALTVLPGIAVSSKKALSIQDKIASGLVEYETFYVDKTIVIDIPNIIIRKCRFIAVNDMDVMCYIGSNAKYLSLTDCFFDTKGFDVESGFRVEAQQGDMTKILQSAIDHSPKGINLAPGEYRISTPLKYD